MSMLLELGFWNHRCRRREQVGFGAESPSDTPRGRRQAPVAAGEAVGADARGGSLGVVMIAHPQAHR
ncbi:similar to RIKEN cDNA 4933428G09 (predicted), isoform CRA_d [Rattus norvegicus]|uniref:Uncharacterized protein n=1 Tax=Rattus norvegicus TaxID=10116 RepID=A6IJK5_RAT|nr:similar to RIKEN cDNA 4933428G09 (predicted), isoform CRA_d [Rattus norvegicus]